MLSAVTHIIMLGGLLVGTIADLRTREVPDWLNFSLIASGLGLGTLASVAETSWHPLIGSVAGLALGVLLGYVMFYAGQWGGGDAKLIMGLGALFGLPLFSPWGWTNLPLLVVFLINALLVGAAYGLAWAVGMVVTHWSEVKAAFKEHLHTRRVLVLRRVILAVVVAAVLAGVLMGGLVGLVWFLLAAAVFFTFYLWVLVQVVEKTCMAGRKRVSRLTEGDWIDKEVRTKRPYKSVVADLHERQMEDLEEHEEYDFLLGWARQLGLHGSADRRKKRLRRKIVKGEARIAEDVVAAFERHVKRSLPERLRKRLRDACTGPEKGLKEADRQCTKDGFPSFLSFLEKRYAYTPRQRHLAGPGDLGVSRRQIASLKKTGVKEVVVKEGIPFVPSFLVAYVVTLAFGSWFVFFI